MASVWIQLLFRPRHYARRTEFDPGIDSPSSDRDSDSRGDHHHRHRHRHGHGRHRRQPADHPARNPCHGLHRAERESVQSDHGISESGADINDGAGVASSTISTASQIRNYQLPGAVLQARARLLERLRGASLTPSRQGTTASGIIWDELAVGDDSNFNSYGDPETETHMEQFGSAGPFVGFVSHDAQLKKASELNWEGMKESLECCREVFKNSGESDQTMKESLECCICLEKFAEGDGLVRLNCTHRFHPACLEPWLQKISSCPCCRANIKC